MRIKLLIMTNNARINISLDYLEELDNFYILFKNDLILASNQYNTVINIPLRKFNGEEGSLFAISESAENMMNYLK